MKDTDPVSGLEDSLDLRGTPCPLNFIRAKLKLQQLPPGSVLRILLDPGEPIEQVPDSLKIEGYPIQEIQEQSGFYILTVQRPGRTL
ncbi:sulfurtransferase TusA family protein [Lyngbya confervoides]|uniref:Sulfurtransferase TusA family protein n=1 Tax=Lyngbya confervoides BDU141951 TaxID=1574623 RepID=A0ABD4T536_9CYAN|nr:sulfurtransferase TusA family protein [Lyngbya confervoides]MCM1983470.1 sulfurtransferase TusA family protein [Lyngbya confervoides BDU141951]